MKEGETIWVQVESVDDGQKRIETSTDLYPPTIEIYRVPPGYNPDELPPVGEDPNVEKKPDAKEQLG